MNIFNLTLNNRIINLYLAHIFTIIDYHELFSTKSEYIEMAKLF